MALEKTKEAIIDLINTGEELEEILDDGRISVREGFGLVDDGIKIAKIIKNIPEISTEIKQATAADLAALPGLVDDELDLDNDNLEEMIELAFRAIINIVAMFDARNK